LIVLDCESFESALRSISELYGASPQEVQKFLSNLDLTDYSQLRPMFEAHFGPHKSLDAVCWFHLTRVPANTKFSEGILPLHEALAKIWNTLISIPTDKGKRANLEQLKMVGVPNDLYLMKTQNRIHSGPYAMLVREVAFHANAVGNHDYLEFPEIVEDICEGYKEKFGDNIHEEIANTLRRCIVKVELPADDDVDDIIESALLYCWCKINNEELSFASNTCFDGGGASIPFESIRKIEFVD
jgi:hypothetical protein